MSGVPAGSYSGPYALTARAIDNGGAATTSAAVAVTVSTSAGNQPPVVTLTAPSNGATYTAPATIVMTATASDADGIGRVEFYQGANKLGEDYTSPYTWTIFGAPAGNYSGGYALTARAFDNRGTSATSNAVSVTVSAGASNQPPVVSLTAPFNGAVYNAPGIIVMTATASDYDGSISRVEFYQGANKLGERYAPPYTWTIYGAPAGVYSGAYALTVKAFDNRGAVTTSNAVAVTVR
jgi:hypothetical protein